MITYGVFGLNMYMYLVRLSVFLAYTCICISLGYLCSWLIHVYVSRKVICVLGLYMYMYLVRLSVFLAYTCICISLGYLCSWLKHVYVSR